MSGLWVIEMFDSLQGEGFWTGVPMTFVRLAGCNAPELGLDCARWCDTPSSWDAHAGAELAPEEILDRVRLPRLCLTGGEPLLQSEGTARLVQAAHRVHVKIHLETNGTLPPPAGGEESLFDWAVVSPKPPDFLVAPEWEGAVDELKLVADERLDAVTVERLVECHPGAIVCIQPLWGTSGPAPASAKRAIGLVMEHPDWRISLQTHKLLGLR